MHVLYNMDADKTLTCVKLKLKLKNKIFELERWLRKGKKRKVGEMVQ